MTPTLYCSILEICCALSHYMVQEVLFSCAHQPAAQKRDYSFSLVGYVYWCCGVYCVQVCASGQPLADEDCRSPKSRQRVHLNTHNAGGCIKIPLSALCSVSGLYRQLLGNAMQALRPMPLTESMSGSLIAHLY
jgi:hypothetical protein